MRGPQAEKKSIFKRDSLRNPSGPYSCPWGCVGLEGRSHLARQAQFALSLVLWAWLTNVPPPSVVKSFLVSLGPSLEWSLYQSGGLICTWECQWCRRLVFFDDNCSFWLWDVCVGGDSQRLGLRQGRIELEFRVCLSAY